MSWLSPEAWLAACGSRAAGLRRGFEERGGEAELADAIIGGPRRLVALVGAPGTGTSRLALELAHRWPRARYRDPLAPPADDTAELGELADAPLLVVVDGPLEEEAVAALPALVARALVPDLRVVVPCDPDRARRLGYLAGDYPRASILVAELGGDAVEPEPLGEVDRAALLPFALAGRAPAGRLAGEDALVDAGVLARHSPSATVVCLIGERQRRALMAPLVAADDDRAIAALVEAAPSCGAAALTNLLRWTGGSPPARLLARATELDAGALVDPLAAIQGGVPLGPEAVAAIDRRAEALLAGELAPDLAARLDLARAGAASLRRDREGTAAHLRAAVARSPSPAVRARALAWLGGSARDLELTRAAVDAAREGDDARALARALDQHARLLREYRHAHDALAPAVERIELAESAAEAAAAKLAAATLATEVDDLDRALALGEAALADRRAAGDPVGQLFALYSLARWSADARAIDRAESYLIGAEALAADIGDARGLGYCHWMLGAIGDMRADAETASHHYGVAVEAYAAIGPVPDRLMASLRRSSVAAAEVARQREGGASPEAESGRAATVDLPGVPEPGEQLVQLGRSKPR